MTAGGAEPRAGDPLAVALAAVVHGTAAGGALVCVLLFATYPMLRGAGSIGPRADILLLAGLGGLGAAVSVAWFRARGLEPWRRAMAGAVAFGGAIVVAMATMPADLLWPRWGLLALAGLCGGASLWTRRAVRAGWAP